MKDQMVKMELDSREYEQACKHFMIHVKGIGALTAIKMIDDYGSARRVWELREEDIWWDQRMNSRQKSNLIEHRRHWDLEREWQRLKDKGIKMVSYDDQAYPSRLKPIPDKPFLLYYRGGLPAETSPCVAVIGARMCSEYGRRTAGEFAAGLAERGIQVISGMADGIDGIAQRSALENGGMSYGILGCGVDICYPLSNRTLYQQLIVHGGVISEFLPGSKPEAGHFPMRNRIISGLADLILVIEAKERSGTRITVNMALEQGKEVYAVPGRITDELSRGCHRMIRDGAGMAVDVDEIAEAAILAWERNCGLYWVDQKGRADDTGRKSIWTPGDEEAAMVQIDSSKAAETIQKEREGMGEAEGKEVKREKEMQGKKEIEEREEIEESKEIEERILQLLKKKGMNADEILNCLLAQKRQTDGLVNISMVQGILSKLMLMGRIAYHGGVYELKDYYSV